MRRQDIVVVGCLISLASCGPNTTPDAGTDAGHHDSGPPDPCTADQAHSTSTLGCNGPPATAHAAPNEFGGECDVDPTELMTAGHAIQGTCLHDTDVCSGAPGTRGICLRHCDPAPTYVSTGTCPSGARCFVLNLVYGAVFCYADCYSGADCVTGVCDEDGSCEYPDYMHDAGPPDSGAVDDAGTDDAATTLDAAPSDAGVLPDAGDAG